MQGGDIPQSTLKALQAIRPPKDYFGETCSSDKLWPHHILCFTRKSQHETAAEPLARNHHHRHVLVIPCQGRGKVFIDDRQLSVSYPEVLLIFPFQYHHGYNFDRAHVLWLYVTFEIENGDALDSLRLNPIRILAKDDFLDRVEAGRGMDLQSQSGRISLLAWPSSGPDAESSRAEPGWRKTETKNKSIFAATRAHQPLLYGKFTPCHWTNELSLKLGVSQSHLRACFRAETGISLGQHLRRLRLQKAMGLLVQSGLSITQIAERCGFDSIYAFSRSFRKFSGMMAKEYRRRYTRG